MNPAYYNEHDPFAAAWLRELIKAGLIAPGEVDERSIEDVAPADLDGFHQVHLFAGIGVWSWALRQAGWPDDWDVWTISCPCQPFSAAGKGAGFADERHLWPAAFHLLRARRPVTVFGEQVASRDGLTWLDLVFSDLEGEAYACGAVDTCAAGFGAPHIRQRLYWVADAQGFGSRAGLRNRGQGEQRWPFAPDSSATRGLADADHAERRPDHAGGDNRDGQKAGRRQGAGDVAGGCGAGRLADLHGERLDGKPVRLLAGGQEQEGVETPRRGLSGSLGNPGCQGLPHGEPQELQGAWGGAKGRAAGQSSRSFWADAVWLPCRDGKARPVDPGTFPLAHGAPARVGRLRGYGNALCAPQAKGFIEAVMSVLESGKR